jgi:predicted RNase H-like nuclease
VEEVKKEAEQRKLDLERIAKLKAKPQRYDSILVKEVKEYLKNVEKLVPEKMEKDDAYE